MPVRDTKLKGCKRNSSVSVQHVEKDPQYECASDETYVALELELSYKVFKQRMLKTKKEAQIAHHSQH